MISDIRTVFHPGVYLKEYIEEMKLSQNEFAKRLGISGKQLSLILKYEANITVDIAYRLSKLIGTSPDFWIKLQNKYDIYLIKTQ